MAALMQTYSGVPSRNLIRAERAFLKHAEPLVVLGSFGMQKELPKNATDTMVFRRLNPFNMKTSGAGTGTPQITPSNFLLAEGTVPNTNTISYTDVPVTVQEYGILFKFSSKAEYLYEDDIPSDMQKLTGETMAELSELIQYGQIKGGTTVFYANGSARNQVNSIVTIAKLRAIARTLMSNRARKVTQRIAPGPNFGTASVQPSYLVFHHTDANADIRSLSGFTKVEDYGSFKPVHPQEIGSVEEFRFIASPLFAPWADAGGTAATNNTVSTSGTNSDVYPLIVMAEDAWGQLALKGMGVAKPTIIRSSEKNHANPLGQFGFVGANFYMAAVRLNENWMARLEVAVTAL